LKFVIAWIPEHDVSSFYFTMAGGQMHSLDLHFINARQTLSAQRPWIDEALQRTWRQANSHLEINALDVVIKAGQFVLEGKGCLGYSSEPGIIYLTIDPHSHDLTQESLTRMFAHELHHAARWDGPGYGRMLGEALVSEGLAGHFSQEVCGGEPEPWETLAPSLFAPYVDRAIEQWSQPFYDHNAWFFGSADMPRWLGYSLGYALVRRYLLAHPQQSAAQLALNPAADFHEYLIAM